MDWSVVLERDQETGDWAVWCPELPGCASAGETQEEALENIREAIALHVGCDATDVRLTIGREPTAAGEREDGRATALAAEAALSAIWDTPEENDAWRDLNDGPGSRTPPARL